jgi:hypothetical protein
MMGAVVLAELTNKGLWVERRGDDLYVAPRSKLTDTDRERVHAFKADILTEIRRTEAGQALKDTLTTIGKLRIHSANRIVARNRMAMFATMLHSLFEQGEWDSIRYCLLDFRRSMEALTSVSRGEPHDRFGLCEVCHEPAGLVVPDGRRFCGISHYQTAMPEGPAQRRE